MFALILAGIAGFFGVIGAVSLGGAYKETRRYAIIPPTSITSAVEFSSDHSDMFEPERRNYSFRNREFSEAFLAANRDALWDGQKRVRASINRQFFYGAVAVAVAAVLAWQAWQWWTGGG